MSMAGGLASLTALLDRCCRRRYLLPVVAGWLATSSWLFLFGPFQAARSAGSGPLLDERFGYSVMEAQAFLNRLGDAGRGLYARFLLLDLAIMVLLGGAGLMLLVGWLRRRLAPEAVRWDWLVLVPVLVSLCDAIENFSILLALPGPADAAGLLTLAGYATAAKHGLGRILMPALVAGFGWLGLKRLTGRLRCPRRSPAPP